MTCEIKKIDSNTVGLAYAEESCLGILPGASEDEGVWYPLDPNSYADFGADYQMTARNPINDSRQRRKGVITGLEASGGFQQDLTQNNLTRLMQGFFFADAHERPNNAPINGVTAITSTVADIEASGVINVAAGKGALFSVGDLIKLSGFVNEANNIPIAMVTTIAADELTIDVTTTVVESYTVGKLEVIGFDYDDLQVAYSGGVLTLTSATGFADQGYQVGEWIFVGGDTAAQQFANNSPGYARIEAVGANTLTLKEATWTPVTDTGTAKTVRIFSGVYIRNEKTTSLIKRRSYQIERTLGNDANGTQSEVLTGAVANEFTMSFDSADKIMCDLSFIAKDTDIRPGATGLKPGTRTAVLPNEDAFNTSNDVYQMRLFVHGATPTPVSLFAYVMSGKITINNNASAQTAIGTLGAFEISVGDFEVSGSLEVYFASVAAVNAVKANEDVGFNAILATKNTGMVYDIPLLSLGGGRVSVEKDQPIMLPLEKQAAENANGYTMSGTYFSYLPTVAMPTE